MVAIVIGASRNLGRGIAEGLAKAGADVVVHHHGASSAAAAEETASLVRAAGRRALVVPGDLSELAEIRALFDRTEAAFGRPDAVVNTAGLIVKKPFVEVTEEDFDRSFAINAKAAFFVMQEAAKRLADNGRIVNIGTSLLAATTGLYSVYAGSKAPLEDFTRALAKEVGGRGITVNTVAPGPIDTPFFHGPETPQSVAYVKSASPQGRLATVDDIVPTVVFLASEQARWVTAQTVFVNGGYVAR